MKKHFTSAHIVLFVGILCAVLAPIIFTQSLNWCNSFDFTIDNKGDIGDAIGGITAPIVGIMGAFLVYLALKEQVKANTLIQEQLYFQYLSEQIQRLEDDFLQIAKITYEIEKEVRILDNFPNGTLANPKLLMKKVDYSLEIFKEMETIVKKISTEENRKIIEAKIKILKTTIYEPNYTRLKKSWTENKDNKSKSELITDTDCISIFEKL